MKHTYLALAVLIGFASMLTGCGDDGGGVAVVTPRVTQTFPEDGAAGVDLTIAISVWFSRDMEEATLDSVYVLEIPASQREYDSSEKKLTLYPDGMLDPDSTYHVRVSSYCMDMDGNNLAQDYTFSFTSGQFICDDMLDRFEPNDDVSSATPIEIGVTYPMLVSCGDGERRDFYEFTLDAPAKVTATTKMANMDTSYVSWWIFWVNENGDDYVTRGTSFEEGDSTASFHYSFLPGTYYVMVGKSEVDHHFVVYDLTLETSDACPDDEYEDNDFLYEAAPITPGTYEDLRGCYVDADFFAIDLTTGQTLTVTVTEITTNDYLKRLVIYDPDLYSKTGDTDWDNPKTESWTAEMDGPHYFQVRWWSEEVIYNLNVEVSD